LGSRLYARKVRPENRIQGRDRDDAAFFGLQRMIENPPAEGCGVWVGVTGLKDEGGYFGRLMGASSLIACIPSLKDLIDGPVQVVATGEPFGHSRAVRRIIAKSTCFHQPGYQQPGLFG
jgi:hypothetical protein